MEKQLEDLKKIKEIQQSTIYIAGGTVAININAENSLIRYTSGGDYKRTVVEAIFNKLKNTNIIEYPSVINEFLPFVETNMSSSDMLGLAKDFSTLISKGLQQDRFPRDYQGVGQMIEGVYYLTFDREAVKNNLHNYIFEDK